MVSFILSPEQEELAATARRFFSDNSPTAAVRAAMSSAEGIDWTVWRRLGQDLGLLGVAVPEEYGGGGASFVELSVVAEEAGRALLCAPWLASAVLASNALLMSGQKDAMARYLPRLVTGDLIGTVAFGENDGTWSARDTQLAATDANGRWTLDGTLTYVIDGHAAGIVMALAQAPDGTPALFAVPMASGSSEREALPALDQTRRLSHLTLRGAPAELLVAGPRSQQVMERVLHLGVAALAAEQLGAASRSFEMTLGYLKFRHQFERPIGSFQALKHRCADLAMELESARALVMYAARAAAVAADDLATAASTAKAYTSDAYFHVAAEGIQMLGGIGFTWEHDAHLFFKRAAADRLLLGSPEFHNELLLAAIGV